jgi:anti-sigma factor RsiW
MSPERFTQLAQAYGGRLRLWPAGEREAARALLEQRPELARILAEAGALDALLDASPNPVPTAALAWKIVQTAPRPPWSLPGSLVWWAGAGLASAGAMAGALTVLLAPAPSAGPDGWVYDQATAFGALLPSQDG